jgi:hypothetical protein
MVGYDVPEASDVTLCLYDAAGRKLAVLAAGRHEAGRYSIPFGPCILSSGVYFLRLEAPAARLSRKVTASAGD